MGEYSKKLHIRKDSTVEDIVLYTDTSGFSGGALALRDGSNIVYAALGSITDSAASRLRVRKNGTVYAALKSGYPTGSVTYKCNSPKEKASYTINLPAGTKKILLTGSLGPGPKKISTYISVTSSYVILRLLVTHNDNRGNYNHIIQVTNPNGDSLFLDGNGSVGNFYSFWGSISWSPTINNS